MDIFTALDPSSEYSTAQLQLIIAAWVMATPFERKAKVATSDGDVAEEDYDKRSIYSLLYSMYRSMGKVYSETGEKYEFTFNTWGYAWPKTWRESTVKKGDPERFGKYAYSGLFEFPEVQAYVAAREGRVHVVEMGCGTGAGANHICRNVLPNCTYEAVDMQKAAIESCKRMFVPQLNGRLKATRADCTDLPIGDNVADFVVINETHVTEMPGRVTDEDKKFFASMHRVLKPGGFLVWGNAIPDNTWQPCFDHLNSIGMKTVEVRDVTQEAIAARDQDERRADAYVEQCLNRFVGFRIPRYGRKKRVEARQAMMNFYRNPGTRLYVNMENRTDTYKVAAFQKQA